VFSERDGVLEVTLNRPDKYNSISNTMLDGLRSALDTFASRRDL
jgi:enoyl-CoA hydratase/carnithine racemase